MKDLLSRLTIQVSDRIYLKDPESSDLGKRMISASIEMLDHVGFEAFTFRKLAQQIGSTEASIYRYFESKHKLLLYLASWYWGWIEYRLVFRLANIASAEERLKRAIHTVTEHTVQDGDFEHINETKLNRVVISESSKAYLVKAVDEVNKEGAYSGYKSLVGRISNIISEIDPAYKYPHMLVSTVIEGAHHQRYFAEHLPKLTDSIKGEDSITEFYTDMVFKTLGLNREK